MATAAANAAHQWADDFDAMSAKELKTFIAMAGDGKILRVPMYGSARNTHEKHELIERARTLNAVAVNAAATSYGSIDDMRNSRGSSPRAAATWTGWRGVISSRWRLTSRGKLSEARIRNINVKLARETGNPRRRQDSGTVLLYAVLPEEILMSVLPKLPITVAVPTILVPLAELTLPEALMCFKVLALSLAEVLPTLVLALWVTPSAT